jgi:hypothetical protein
MGNTMRAKGLGAIALATFLVTTTSLVPALGAQEEARRQGYDQLLDTMVRDGLVYYRALKSDRSRLDAYVSSLRTASLASASANEQKAFWINAYNAIVLQTVINHYPIQQRSREYPPRSIRQIPGAFERMAHQVAGRALTLDQIEQTVLPTFSDPRMLFALGRGAMGSGRLRSEAYTGGNIERHLSEMATECVTRTQCFSTDRGANVVRFSSIFSWREKEFVAAFEQKAPAMFSTRSPVERAMLAFVGPKLLTTERDFLDKNEFRIEFIPLDWSLNDLTGR